VPQRLGFPSPGGFYHKVVLTIEMSYDINTSVGISIRGNDRPCERIKMPIFSNVQHVGHVYI